jgi:hypothetical protein
MFGIVLMAVPQLLAQRVVFQCPSSQFTVAEGINSSGTVAGYYYINTGGGAHGFIYSAGTCTTFDVSGATNTVALAINDAGIVSGYYQDASNFFHGFLRSAAGVITTLDFPTSFSNSLGLDINNGGTSVLLDTNGTVFLHSGTTFSQLVLNHTFATFAKMGINDAQNVLVGTSANQQSCFIDSIPVATSTSFSVSGAAFTFCFDVNNAGTIAGQYTTSQGQQFAFIRVGSAVVTLPGLTNASANGLNDIGQIVGSTSVTNGVAAFITNTTNLGVVPGDFNLDGFTDLLWQNDSSGQAIVWYLDSSLGNTFLSTATVAAPGAMPGWTLIGAADFNGDGSPDLVWQNNTTRQVYVWYMGGAAGNNFLGATFLALTGLSGWHIAALADINGDGFQDLVWQNDTTRQVFVWYMSGPLGNQFLGSTFLDPNGQIGWSLIGAADLNGDGTPDLVWQNDTTRQVYVWYMGGPLGNMYLGATFLDPNGQIGWTVAGLADLNHDGHPDLIWQNDTTRQVFVWYLGGALGNQFLGSIFIDPQGHPGWTVKARY